MKNKTKFLLTTLFILVAFLLLGTTNVNATTVTVETEQQLRDALDGVKEVDGSTVIDTDTTVVELGKDIKLSGHFDIYPITNLTLDLKGYTIDAGTRMKEIHINYGISGNNKQHFSSGSLTIKDSSDSKTGKVTFYNPIKLRAYNGDDSIKNFKLIIEVGKFYSANGSTIFELDSAKMNKNVTFNFQVKDGYFETLTNQAILLKANDLDTYNVTLNVDYDKLTFKGLIPRLLYSNDRAFTLEDIVSSDSNISIKNTTDNETKTIENRTLSAISSDPFEEILSGYDTIEITKAEGFDVENVTLNETYGYGTATAKGIKITNRGANPLKVKTVSVSNTDGTASTNFIVTDTVGTTDYLEIASEDSNDTRYTIKAKTGLDAGTYTAVITVTDENDKTYTSTVKVVVAKKSVEGLGISYNGDWKYGETPTTLTKSGVDGLSVGQYVVDYSVHDANDWSTAVPTLAGNYDVRIRVVDPNYDNTTEAITQFNIKPIDTQIRIVPNNHEWTYDGSSHSDNTYKVFYGDTEVTTGVLPTGDTISAVITGSVTDVDDTKTANNKITSYTITNSVGVDVKACYSNIVEAQGTLTIKPIETQIVVTAGSATKTYDGTALTQDSFTYTDGVILAGDTLKVVTKGSQTFVGTSDNEVSTEPLSVTVWRGEKNITSNYRFGIHINGTLKVEAASQTPTIATQYVVKGNVKTIDDLKQAVSGTEGNLDFEIVSGNSFVEYVEGTGYKAKDLGIVEMKVTAQSLNIGGDASPEYSEGSTTFNLEITNKETVTIGGITDNQEFTYDGNTHTPVGTLTFSNSNVTTSDLEISYAGTTTNGTTYSSTTAPTNAGTYSVTYKIKDSNENYAGEQVFNFTIKKVQLAKVTLKQSSFVYTGENIALEFNNFKSDLMMLLGGYGEAVPQVKNANSYNFSVSLRDTNNYEWFDGTTDNKPLTVVVTKADPSYTVPTNLTGLKDQTLNDIELPTRFTWNTPSTPLVVGTYTYTATYTPEDTDNYNVIDDIEITVVTKNIFNVTTEVVGGNGTISTSYANVVEGSTKEITFTPNTGYMIDKVTVNGTPVTVTNNKLTLTVDENKDVKVSYKKIPFTITVVDTEGATVDPNGAVVNYGDNKQFTIYADYGYNFVKVLVNGVDKTDEMVGDTLTLNNITASMEIKVVVEKINYEVIEGANQEYTITKDTEAKFRIDAEYGLFMQGGKVYVDDELVNEDNYTTKEGSTVVILKQSYVDTLSVGKHTLKVTFADGGEATTNFTIAKVVEKPTPEEDPKVDVDNNNTNTENKEEIKEEDNSSNPKTFDNIMVYVAIAIMSVVGLGATVIIKKKKVN